MACIQGHFVCEGEDEDGKTEERQTDRQERNKGRKTDFDEKWSGPPTRLRHPFLVRFSKRGGAGERSVAEADELGGRHYFQRQSNQEPARAVRPLMV